MSMPWKYRAECDSGLIYAIEVFVTGVCEVGLRCNRNQDIVMAAILN